MDLNLIVLGALTILTLFGVGESLLKKLNISRVFVVLTLILLIAGLYVPNLKIKQVSLSISGVVLPAVFCLILCWKIRSFSFFLSFLLMSFTTLLLRLGFYETQFMPIYVQLVSMFSIGFIIGFLSKEPYSAILACLLGFFAGNIIFELIKFGNIYNLLSTNNISFVLLSQSSSCVIIFAKKLFSFRFKKQANSKH